MKPSRTPLTFVPSLFFLICLASLAFKSRAACSNDGDCTNNAKPYCSSGTCVECTANSECGSRSAARCSSGDCVACTSDSECSKFTGYTQCDSGTCYECATGDNSPCTSVSASQCISHQCSSCTSDSGCTQFSSYKYCASYSGTEFCGVCKSDAQCLTYSSAQCIVNYLNSYCTSCSTNSNCAHFDRNLYCSSGNCIQCYTNYECKNFPSASRCDYSVSPPINTCMPCSSSSDCSYVTGLPVCISGTCYECQYDSQCNLTTKAYCNPSHVCVPCISDANCDHFSPLKYCALDTVCKKIKVNITAQSSDRIIPEKLISYKITMATYPVGQTLTFSWNLSDTGITINQQTQYLLALDCFGKNVPLPTSITIGYSISDSSSGYDSLILTLPVNRAPNGGLVSITPTTGVGLSTLFTLKAQSWTDGDGDAISYKFYFAVDKDKKYIPLKDFQTATTLATLLPSGAFDQNSTFYIKVAATDAYGIENYAETSFTVTLSQQSISDVLTNLQNQVISPVLAASFIKNIENEIMSSPLLGCPVCSYHGSCSDGACVCETGYVLSGCELSQTDFNNLISVKTEILTQINTQISNYGVTEFLAEQSLAITRLTTYYLELTNTNFITQSLALINNIMSNAISQNVSLHLAALTDAAQTTENLFTFTTQDCKQKKSITTTLQNNIMPLFQSLPAINLKMRNSTDPYIIDTDQFYICIQQGVLAENLKGESFYCGACLVSLPSAGISAPDGTYVNIELIIPKTTFSDCDPSSFSFSPYQIFFTKLGDKSTSYTASGTVTVTFPISLGLSCTDPYVAAENSTGDLNCVIINDDSLNSLIKDSNLFKITNISALKDFDVLHSPLFYVVAGFSLMMLIVSLWSIYKDRQLDRDLLKLPNKSPSKIYKMLVYISICHTFFGIFVLFDSKQPRIMRSVLFYLKILGLMTLSTIFNQTAKDNGTVKKTAISIITLICLTPINGIIAYLVFKRNIEPKIRRKRAAVQTRKAQLPLENKQLEELRERRKKRFTKIFNIIGYSSVIIIILIYTYIIFVVTANNVQNSSDVVEKWMLGFLQSTAMDFFGVQIIKALVHLGIISTLQNENKKKFLCIPRKHLPRMVNANIWDFKKRFAVLDSLYSKNGKLKAEVERTQTENLTSLGPGTMRVNNVNAAILGRPDFNHLNTLSVPNDTSAFDTFQENSFMDRSSDVMLEAKFSFQNSPSPGLQRAPSNMQIPSLQRALSNMQSPGLQRVSSQNAQLDTLESQLEERKRARSLSIRKLQRNRKIIMGNQLMAHAQAQGHGNGDGFQN